MIKTLSSNFELDRGNNLYSAGSAMQSVSLRVKWRAGDKIRVSRQCWLAKLSQTQTAAQTSQVAAGQRRVSGVASTSPSHLDWLHSITDNIDAILTRVSRSESC